MIVRYSITCETCDQPHTVRIGMGQEEYQTHHFPCRSCGEDIVIGLEVDYENVSFKALCVSNSKQAKEVVDAPIVNVDANFLIPSEEQGKDRSFPRLKQMHEMAEEALKKGFPPAFDRLSLSDGVLHHTRRNHAGEWRLLKKAWSLHNNGRTKLSNKCITNASANLYSHEPLNDISDWIWRLASTLCQPSFESKFENIMKTIQPLFENNKLKGLSLYYKERAHARGARTFNLMKEYFASFSEFGQVYFLVAQDIDIPDNHQATSSNFDLTKMFYGNAFETFASHVDLLAFLNNILQGRAFDTFEELTLSKYKKLDKASRFNPFAQNSAFATICSEADNQIRNASHHSSFIFDQANQIIRYRSGKGGTGQEQSMSYSTYLQKCTHLFLQFMTLLRVELILCNRMNIKYPN